MMSIPRLLRKASAPICQQFQRSGIFTTAMAQAKAEVALVMSGCGVFDGTDVHEASAIMVHLSKADVDFTVFAPDIDQYQVINHTKGAPEEDQKRNVFEETARITRGDLMRLHKLKAEDWDAVIFPGGLGVVKNLSTFPIDRTELKMDENVERVLEEFHAIKKPIGIMDIGAVLVAKKFKGARVTVGNDDEMGGKWPHARAAGVIKQLGANHVNTEVNEACVDEENRIVTTPAFMAHAKHYEVHDGIGQFIKDMITLIEKSKK